MKKKTIVSLMFFMALSFTAWTQNLVPNDSFEDTIQCPTVQQFIGYVSNWTGGAQPIYFNRYCDDANTGEVPTNFFGHQYPHSGNAYVGIYTFLKTTSSDTAERSYVEVKLTYALLPSVKYFVTFYVSLADTFKYACNNIGALFSDSIINCNGYVTYHTPQIENDTANHLIDKVNWMKVSGNFIALGGEQYITIGNFQNDARSDTVFVDSKAPAGYAPAACYYIDDVIVSPDSNYADSLFSSVPSISQPKEVVQVYPNPASTVLTVQFLTPLQQGEHLCMYNIIGEQVESVQLKQGQTMVSVAELPEGIYLYRILTDEELQVQSGKVIVEH